MLRDTLALTMNGKFAKPTVCTLDLKNKLVKFLGMFFMMM